MADFEVKDGIAVIPEETEQIGSGAFGDLEGFTTVVIPKSVTKIDAQTGLARSSATNVVVEEGNEKYDSRNNCNAIIRTDMNKLYAGCATTIIPDTVEVIGWGAFRGCEKLTSIVIPNSVKKIEANAFALCKNLASIEIPNSVTEIGESAFEGCESLTSIVIPDSVCRVEYDAFAGCKNLKSIVIPSTTYLSDSSLTSFSMTNSMRLPFKDCPALASITITKGSGEEEYYDSDHDCNAIIEKENNALRLGCAASVIPDGVAEIDAEAFLGCGGLTSIDIPASVTKIGESAFKGCTGLNSITLPSSVTIIGQQTFNGCTSLTDVVIPESVTEIGDGAFSGCSCLKSVVLPESITTIPWAAFSSTGLTEVVIHDQITELKGRAFFGCEALTTITLPKAVKKIDERTFEGCTSLKNINVPAKRTDYYKKRLPENLHGLIVELPAEKKAKK